jgi:hypothetical protein
MTHPSQERGGTTCDIDGGIPARFSGPYRAEHVFIFTQAKAWAEFLLALRAVGEPSEDTSLNEFAVQRAMKAGPGP